MVKNVDYHGQSKAGLEAKNESIYNWHFCDPRLTVLMQSYSRDTLEKQAKAAVTDVSKENTTCWPSQTRLARWLY